MQEISENEKLSKKIVQHPIKKFNYFSYSFDEHNDIQITAKKN